MKAVIMAGGDGKRLRPLSCTMPKPMVPLLNKPVLGYCMELIKKHGFDEAILTLRYLPNVIRRYIGNGSAFGIKAECAVEAAVRFHAVTHACCTLQICSAEEERRL